MRQTLLWASLLGLAGCSKPTLLPPLPGETRAIVGLGLSSHRGFAADVEGGQAVLIPPNEEPRAILAYDQPLEALGMLAGPLLEDSVHGCPLPRSQLQLVETSTGWAAAPLSVGAHFDLRSFAPASSASRRYQVSIDCGQSACEHPAISYGCRVDVDASACGDGKLVLYESQGRLSLEPGSILEQCVEVGPRAPAVAQFNCLRAAALCHLEVFLAEEEPQVQRSEPLTSISPAENEVFAGVNVVRSIFPSAISDLARIGARLYVLVGPTRELCDNETPSELVILDAATLSIIERHPLASCGATLRADPSGGGLMVIGRLPAARQLQRCPAYMVEGGPWALYRLDAAGVELERRTLGFNCSAFEELLPLQGQWYVLLREALSAENERDQLIRLNGADLTDTSTLTIPFPPLASDALSITFMSAWDETSLALFDHLSLNLIHLVGATSSAATVAPVRHDPFTGLDLRSAVPLPGGRLLAGTVSGALLGTASAYVIPLTLRGGDSSYARGGGYSLEGAGGTIQLAVLPSRPDFALAGTVGDRVGRIEDRIARIERIDARVAAPRFLPGSVVLGYGPMGKLIIDPDSGDVYTSLSWEARVLAIRGLAK
ncbi:MAG: hypothetical protein U1E65_04155 [Myxococcota bacterium]